MLGFLAIYFLFFALCSNLWGLSLSPYVFILWAFSFSPSTSLRFSFHPWNVAVPLPVLIKVIRLWLKQFGRNQHIAGLHVLLANCILSFRVRIQLFCVPSLNSRSKASILPISSILCWMQEKEDWNNSWAFHSFCIQSLSQMKRSWIITQGTIQVGDKFHYNFKACLQAHPCGHKCESWFNNPSAEISSTMSHGSNVTRKGIASSLQQLQTYNN